MTKTTKTAAILTTEVQGQVPAVEAPMIPASITVLPPTLRLMGPALIVLSEMMIHARLGYMVDTEAPVDQFAHAGNLSLFLRLGTPSAGIVKIAQATVEAAAAQQRVQYENDVAAAAKQLVEDNERAAKDAAVQAVIAETQARIKELQATLTA